VAAQALLVGATRVATVAQTSAGVGLANAVAAVTTHGTRAQCRRHGVSRILVDDGTCAIGGSRQGRRAGSTRRRACGVATITIDTIVGGAGVGIRAI